MTDINFDRRDMFKGLLAISAAGALAACGGAQGTGSSQDTVSNEAGSGFFNESELALISALADTIIPTKETPGAVAAGVPDTLQALATEWGDDGFRTYWRDGLSTMKAALAEQSGSEFEALSTNQREAELSAYDARVFDGETEDDFYRDFKSTLVQAYYMSEPGATEELAYEPVPGEWIGCVPLADFPKTWAT
ncbi:MAG: gluconate 2-dehydrogenase subunit 3 family protein [Henriciella sp.]